MNRFSLALAALALTACAGDRVTAPAAPEPKALVRSVNATGADRTPLVFLNGLEIAAADLDAIDRNAIESVEVFKGKKAVEAYGVRGANGVIFIVSKR